MKKLLFGSLFVAIVLLLILINRDVVFAKTNDILSSSPCEKPKAYSIDTIDSEFQMSDSTLKETISKATEIWNKAYGEEVFVYDPESRFTINLIYDNRQSLNTEIGELNNELKKKDTTLKPEIDEYNRKSEDLRKRINSLNQEIEDWNTRGGAPQSDFESLKSRQTALRKESEELNAWADSLSISTKELNQTIDHLKETVDSYNDELNHKPEGGKYILDEQGERIEINIYDSPVELENILAHELGHSLGMDHVADENSIMFAKTNSKLTPTVYDLAQLRSVCAERNILTESLNNISASFQLRMQQLTGNN